MTKERVVERERTVVKGQSGCWCEIKKSQPLEMTKGRTTIGEKWFLRRCRLRPRDQVSGNEDWLLAIFARQYETRARGCGLVGCALLLHAGIPGAHSENA